MTCFKSCYVSVLHFSAHRSRGVSDKNIPYARPLSHKAERTESHVRMQDCVCVCTCAAVLSACTLKITCGHAHTYACKQWTQALCALQQMFKTLKASTCPDTAELRWYNSRKSVCTFPPHCFKAQSFHATDTLNILFLFLPSVAEVSVEHTHTHMHVQASRACNDSFYLLWHSVRWEL